MNEPKKTSQTITVKKTQTVVGMGLLTAIVIVLQALAVGIRFGSFTITLVLAPIIVGAALYGWKAGAWLGLVFGVVVLFTDAGAFLAVNIPGTIVTVLAKGILAGIAGGLVYSLLSKRIKKNGELVSVLAAGVTLPIVNTGVFLIGCALFFLDTLKEWGAGFGFDNVFSYLIFGMVGLNFLIELAINLVLSSAIVLILNIAKKTILQHRD